jgi:hypothetical protein
MIPYPIRTDKQSVMKIQSPALSVNVIDIDIEIDILNILYTNKHEYDFLI